VRGQLRFWWRATRGGQFNGDLEAMRKAENAIWGSAAKKGDADTGPSKVQVVVAVEKGQEGKGDSPFEVIRNPNNGRPKIQPRPGSSAHPYAAFPLQPKKEEAKIGMQTATVKPAGLEFSLEISYPKEFQKDVTAALWAWETFGGIGGRTRRGFGALQRIDADEGLKNTSHNRLIGWIHQKLQEYEVTGNWAEGIPHLTPNMRLEIYPQTELSGEKAWRGLISKYHNFRQLEVRIDKKTGKKSKYGASIWTEAKALRTIMGKSAAKINKFPRAAFGLPILYHLPHDGEVTFTLQGGKVDSKSDKSYERLASRLILKPLACANGQYVGLAAVLIGPSEPPTGLQIKEPLSVQNPISAKLDLAEAKSEPLNQILHGETDVIEAFLKTLK
jgi:CRISPR-associated protein Cmr1